MKKANLEDENHKINNNNQSDSSSDEDETPSFFDIKNINRKKIKQDANQITVIETKNIIESDDEDETPSFFISTKAKEVIKNTQINDETETNDEDETPSFFVIDKTKVEHEAIDKIKDFNETQIYNEAEADDEETPSFFVNTEAKIEPKLESKIKTRGGIIIIQDAEIKKEDKTKKGDKTKKEDKHAKEDEIDTFDENKINHFAYDKMIIAKKINKLRNTLSKSANPYRKRANTSSLSLTSSGRSIKVLFSLTQSQNPNIRRLQNKNKTNNNKSLNEMSD